MDFDLPSEHDPRRLEIRRWFEENPNPTYRRIAERGLAAPIWPSPWGLGADPEIQYIVETEFVRANITQPIAINPIAINQCGQSLLVHGTEAQRQQFLPPALACESIWCMLFSEPSGGSDLASLRTTARRDGSDYIVNGQKIWCSRAHKAKIGILVARTDSSVPKHRGLSEFIVDMDSPGITVKPIPDMTGEPSHFNEVFLGGVRVPAERLLGKEGDGWKIAVQQLQTERALMTRPGVVWGAGPTARDLMDGLIATGRIQAPLVRDEAAQLYIEGELLRLMAAKVLSNRINGKPAGIEGNVGKMIAAPHGQRLSDLAKRTQGANGLVAHGDELPLAEAQHGMFTNWDYAFWFGPAATLGGGTQEIIKNSLAERVLGLPREFDPSGGLAFSEASKAAS